ncbi:regulator, partial [Streptomyces sp. NPDC002454]
MRPTSRHGRRTNDSARSARAPRDLPLELTALVGRAPELTLLGEATAHSRLVTVVGPGGIGKSRLVARAAATCALPDGARLVDLAPLAAGELVEYAVAQALGLTEHAVRPARAVLVDHFAPQRALLVLDGFSTLTPLFDALAAFHRAHPGVEVVLTERNSD